MAAREVGGLEIYECPKCFGLWAPEDRFDSLVDRAASAAAARQESVEEGSLLPRMDGGNPLDSAVEYRRCPSCDALMNRRNFQKRSGVVVDQCHKHGTWLDANELERIAGYVLSGRAASGAATEAKMKAECEHRAAGAAAFRVQDTSSNSRSIYAGFGHVQKSSAASTIFDLLTGILR
jgi:Zn-finger nucleic acid-binding protein